MKTVGQEPLIRTIKERCRVCYTCVRECPAKAIKISAGQAEVIPPRCIGCGNCVKVCRQHAKQFHSSVDEVFKLIENGEKVAACIAPSFIADFYDIDYQTFVGMVRQLGFAWVTEVAFGADLVARKAMQLMNNKEGKRYISTPCPAVFGYVQRYHPNLVESLMPVVSPMIATARIVRELHGKDVKVVFIGPCIAKKGEAASEEIYGEVNEVLTFKELRHIFKMRGVSPDSVTASEFDPPLAGKGNLFPLSRGMSQASDVFEDLVEGELVVAEGTANFIDAIKEFESGDLDARLLELLCCTGCIMGAGMSNDEPLFKKRSRVSKYVRQIMKKRDKAVWETEMEKYSSIDLSRYFAEYDQRTTEPREENIRKILVRMGKVTSFDELNCGACGYATCFEHATAIHNGYAEVEMCLPYSIEQLHKAVEDLADSNKQLARTRDALKQSEKLAGMGQLAAGIAHELNNPLGVVLMYAHLVLDEMDKKSQTFEDLSIIVHEADRCKNIVSGLLNFARKNKVVLLRVNICEIVDQCLKITPIPDNIILKIGHEVYDPFAEIDRDQIIQVLQNLISNAITAMGESGGTLTVGTDGNEKNITFTVSDTGVGIPEKNLEKLYEPFFTTKQMGKGTGLGLAVTYGIIKMHRGNIKVVSNADPEKGPTGTTFTVTLPRVSVDKA